MAARKKTSPTRAKKKKATPTASRMVAPAGMSAATPGFTVADIRKSVAWYRDVLGFEVNERWESNGKLEAVEMRCGSVSFFLGQDNWKKGRHRMKGQGVRIYCSTFRNVDRYAAHVKAMGSPLTQKPRTEMGMRSFSVEDPDGYQLTIWAVSSR